MKNKNKFRKLLHKREFNKRKKDFAKECDIYFNNLKNSINKMDIKGESVCFDIQNEIEKNFKEFTNLLIAPSYSCVSTAFTKYFCELDFLQGLYRLEDKIK